MKYVPFPQDVEIDILVNDCARRNRNGQQLSNEFVQASELPNYENDDSEPESDDSSSEIQLFLPPENVNDTPLLIVRVWRRIVTFFRKTSL